MHCYSIFFTGYSPLEVEIAVLTDPGGDPSIPPSDYSLGSTATLICRVENATDPVSYHWSSTNANFFAKKSTAMFNRKRLLSAADAGVHTCTVTDHEGDSGQASLAMMFEGTQKIISAPYILRCTFHNKTNDYVYTLNHRHCSACG